MPAAETVSLHHFPDRAGHLLCILGQGPAEKDQLRTEHIDNVDDADSQHFLVLLHDLLQIDIALGCSAEDLSRSKLSAGGFLRCAHQSRHRYICLQAPAPPACAEPALGPDNLVTHFAAAHDAALEDLTVQNDTAAYAAAECKHDNIGIILSGSRCRLTERRTVRIVCNPHRAGNDPAKYFHKIDVLPPQVV